MKKEGVLLIHHPSNNCQRNNIRVIAFYFLTETFIIGKAKNIHRICTKEYFCQAEY